MSDNQRILVCNISDLDTLREKCLNGRNSLNLQISSKSIDEELMIQIMRKIGNRYNTNDFTVLINSIHVSDGIVLK